MFTELYEIMCDSTCFDGECAKIMVVMRSASVILRTEIFPPAFSKESFSVTMDTLNNGFKCIRHSEKVVKQFIRLVQNFLQIITAAADEIEFGDDMLSFVNEFEVKMFRTAMSIERTARMDFDDRSILKIAIYLFTFSPRNTLFVDMITMESLIDFHQIVKGVSTMDTTNRDFTILGLYNVTRCVIADLPQFVRLLMPLDVLQAIIRVLMVEPTQPLITRMLLNTYCVETLRMVLLGCHPHHVQACIDMMRVNGMVERMSKLKPPEILSTRRWQLHGLLQCFHETI